MANLISFLNSVIYFTFDPHQEKFQMWSEKNNKRKGFISCAMDPFKCHRYSKFKDIRKNYKVNEGSSGHV